MKNVAFTICAKNYIGLARVLEESIKLHNPEFQFYIFVADEFSDLDNFNNLPDNILISKDHLDIPENQWNQMSFKYNLTEFCTAIKPSCYKYLFKNIKPSNCIYFDPDILLFNNLNKIIDQLETYSIIVTPHITTIQTSYTGCLDERSLLYSGMYNLGFLALRNDKYSIMLLDWWEKRLEDKCYQNLMEQLFTDQKWMDFLPSFFPTQLLVTSDLGLNVAPWNFYERKIEKRNNILYVSNRLNNSEKISDKLTFVHFSGFDYKALLNSKITQKNIKNLEIYSDLDQLFFIYAKYLNASECTKYFNLKYTYNQFSNGYLISNIFRRLFRRLLEDGKILANPFNSNGDFYKALVINNLLKSKISANDNLSIKNTDNIERKTIVVNKLLKIVFKLIGFDKFFMLIRVFRLYSMVENHVYLIDKEYLRSFKIRS